MKKQGKLEVERGNQRPCLPSPTELHQSRLEFAARTGQSMPVEEPLDRQQHALDVIARSAPVARQHDAFMKERQRAHATVGTSNHAHLAAFVASMIDLE